MGKTVNSGIAHGTNGSPQGKLNQDNFSSKIKELARKEMIKSLINAKVKFTEKDVIFATKDKTGQLIWLEKGNEKAGLQHILYGDENTSGHAKDFETKHGVKKENVAYHIENIISNGTVEYTKLTTRNGKEGFEKLFNKQGKYYMISGIGTNGFVVTAYPIDEIIAKELIRRNKK